MRQRGMARRHQGAAHQHRDPSWAHAFLLPAACDPGRIAIIHGYSCFDLAW
jgi:hypothetical protein